MAKIYIERAYIEDFEEDDGYQILLHVKEGNDHIFVGEVEMTRNISWIHMETNSDGDLLINNSKSMESNKWDHITREILGE